MTRGALVVLLAAGLALAACGRKSPPAVPEGEEARFALPYNLQHGGGYRVRDESTIVVDTPPPAYFPGTGEAGAGSDAGALTFPMPNQ